MKLNIQKYQSGGGMPFVAYQPLNYNPQAQQAPKPTAAQAKEMQSGSKESKGTELLSKEVINEVIKTGMKGEVDQFLKQLNTLEQSGPFDSGFDVAKISALASKANQIITNAASMKEATSKAYENGGLNELAISTTGGLYVRDEDGQLNTVSISDFSKNRDKYQALTVNDLNTARRNDSRLAFDSGTISTIQNAIGIGKVSDIITNVIKQLGTEKEGTNEYRSKDEIKQLFENGIEGLKGKTPTDAQAAGLKELSEVYSKMGSDGIYNLKTTSETQRNHIKEASAFLISMLPANAISLLKARAVVSGNSLSPENIISAAFGSFTDDSHTTDVDYQADMSKLGTTKAAGEKTYNQTPMEQLINGDLNKTSFQLINPDKSPIGMTLQGSLMGSIPDLKGNPLPKAPMSRVLNSGIGTTVDQNKITIGNKKLQPYELDKVIYAGGEVINTMAPANADGTVNLKLLESFNDANKFIENKHITSPAEKNAVYMRYGLPFVHIDNNGATIPTQHLKQFLVTHAYTTNGVNSAVDNDWIHTIDDSEQKNYTKMLTDIYTQYKLPFPAAPSWFTSNKVIQVPVFMPVLQGAQNTVSSYQGHGSSVHANTLAEDLVRQKTNTPKYTQSDILNMK